MKELKIIQNWSNTEVQLCSSWCNWNECNMPKWICLNCGFVECDPCSDDFSKLILTDLQIDAGETSICRNCHYWNTTEEFVDEWKDKKNILLEWDKKRKDYGIAKSEWEKYYQLKKKKRELRGY